MPKITGPRAKSASSSKASKPKTKAATTDRKAKTTSWGPAELKLPLKPKPAAGSRSAASSSYTPPSYSSGGRE